MQVFKAIIIIKLINILGIKSKHVYLWLGLINIKKWSIIKGKQYI